MFSVWLIVFRECLEAALLVGVIAASISHLAHFKKYIIFGITLGLILSSLVAFFIKQLVTDIAGTNDDKFQICIIAVTMTTLIWTILWVRNSANKMKTKVGYLASLPEQNIISKCALVTTIAFVILRESSEILLFVFGIVLTKSLGVVSYVAGSIIGLGSGVVVGYVIYYKIIRINTKNVFNIISIWLTLLASSLGADLAGILNASGVVLYGRRECYDLSSYISDAGFIGRILNFTVGYISKPTILQIIFYTGIMFFITICARISYKYNYRYIK